MPRHLQIIRFIKGDNKYKKGQIDGQADTKERNKRLAKLIAEIEKAEAFEKNEQLSYISDDSTSVINNVDDIFSSNDSDSLDTSLRMPRPIRYSWLSNPPENLSRSITPDLPPPGTLEYYLASVPTTPQRMTPELDDMANFIPYAPPLPISKSDIENNEGVFLSNDDPPSPTSQDKGKKPIRPWELVADDIVETLEILSVSPIKKGIKRRIRRSIIPIHITAALTRSRQGIQLS